MCRQSLSTIHDNYTEEANGFSVNWQHLLETNEDVICRIYIPKTEISYPVVQENDNEEYLKKSIDGKYAKTGTIFADSSNANPFLDFNTVFTDKTL